MISKNELDIIADLSFDIVEDFKILRKHIIKYDFNMQFDSKYARALYEYYNYNYNLAFGIAIRIVNAYYRKLTRLRHNITDMVSSGDVLFLTLTFTDIVLNNTTAETRRRYITRFLSQFGVRAIANIDFGKKNEREHYHSLIQLSHIDNKLYTLGNIDFVRFDKTEDIDAVSSYILKFAQHSIKDSTKGNSLIYIRQKKVKK